MLVYIIVAAILFLGVVAKQSRQMYWIGFWGLFAITAFRNPDLGGSDALIYQAYFQDVPGIFSLLGYESKYSIGYTLLNAFVKTFSDDFMLFQFAYAVVTFYLLHYILSKLKFSYKERCLFLLSYFAFRFIWNEWVVLRQNLSDLFFWAILLAIYDLLEKKRNEVRAYYIKFIGLLVLSISIPALFHTSAYFNIGVLVLLLWFRTFSVKTKVIITVVLCALCLIGAQEIFGRLFSFATSIDSRYEMYGDTGDTAQNIISTIVKYLFFSLFVWHYNTETYKYKQFLLDTMAITCIMSSVNVEIMIRMYEYYAIGFYGIMAIFLHNFTNKHIFMASLFFLGLLIILVRFLLIFGGGMFSQYALGISI